MKIALAAGFVAVLAATQSQAAVIVNDNFDGYTQATFEATWIPTGTAAPTGAPLSTAQSVSPTQSVRLPGTAVAGQYRNRQSFGDIGAISTTTSVTWSFDFYDSTPSSAASRNYLTLQDTTAPAGTNQLISLGLNNFQSNANSGGNYYQARILGFTPPAADPDGGTAELVAAQTSGAFFKLNDFAVGVRSLGWHNLKVIISTDDGLGTDYAFYVDNVLAERVTAGTTAATLRNYDNIVIGSGLTNGSVEAFVDNVYLEVVVPEPTGLTALAGLGVLAAARRSRR